MSKESKDKGFLKGKMVNKKILKKSPRATLVIKEHKNIPYKSLYFNGTRREEYE